MNTNKRIFFKSMAFAMILVMTMVGFVPRVEAGFIPNDQVYQGMDQKEYDRDLDTVRSALENKVITQRLSDLGYSADEIKDRMGQLSPDELHELASNIKNVDVAGDGVGFIVGVLIVVALVLLIFKLTDTTVTIS